MDSLGLVGCQTHKEDNEELVSVPEHLKVRAPDELQGRCDHQEQYDCDDVARDASRCHKTDGDGILHTHTYRGTKCMPNKMQCTYACFACA